MAWKRLEGLLIAKVEGKGFHLGSEYASEGLGGRSLSEVDCKTKSGVAV